MGRMSKEEEKTIVGDIIAAQHEFNTLKEERGMKRKISQFFDRREELSQIALNKKKYLLFMFFTAIFVGHRFYFKHYSSAIFYLPTCWSGFSFAMTLIDFLIVIPKQADKHGNIYL